MSKSGEICDRICPKRPRKAKQGRIAKPKVQHYGLNVDYVATKTRCKNPDSRIYWDGRESLRGEDYKARVQEVLARDGGKCQWGVNSFGYGMCGATAEHVHHKVKRSKARDDRMSNLLSLCAEHHRAMHPEHQTRFGERV